jgi:hypothetical protein
MIHDSIMLLEEQRDQTRKYQYAQHAANENRDDDTEIQMADAGCHFVIQPKVNEEVGRAHPRHHSAQTHQKAAEQPVGEAGRKLRKAAVFQGAHGKYCQGCHYHQKRPVPGLAALLARSLQQGWECTADEADKQPSELRGVICKRPVYDGGKSHHTQRPADAYGDKVD